MSNRVQTMIPESLLATLTSTIEGLNTKLAPYYTALSNDEKRGMRTMSTNREGYVRTIERIAVRNVDALPRNIDPAELTGKLNYYSSLAPLKQELLKLTEMLEEIELTNGADIMKLSDTLASALQGARNYNSALDGALKDVDDWNKRFANRDEVAETPVPAAETLN